MEAVYRVIQSKTIPVGTIFNFNEVPEVGSTLQLGGKDFTVAQTGEILVATSSQDVVVLQREYKQESYITDYRQITEEDVRLEPETRRIFISKEMTVEALVKYLSFHTEVPVRWVKPNVAEIGDGWRLDSDAFQKLKEGEVCYPSRVVEFRL